MGENLSLSKEHDSDCVFVGFTQAQWNVSRNSNFNVEEDKNWGKWKKCLENVEEFTNVEDPPGRSTGFPQGMRSGVIEK